MSKIIKPVSSQDLQNWNVPTDSKIDYYDGKILVVSDGEEESSFGVAAKTGIALLGGIAIFTHAPFVAAVMGVYAAYKVTETVKGLYGGDSDLTTRLLQDLDFEVETQALLPIATAYPICEKTRLDALEIAVDTQDNLTQLEPKRDSLTEVNLNQSQTFHSIPTNEPLDIAESLAVNLQSTLIVGQPGSGKGVCIAMATRAVKRLHPDVTIWAIDPKADPSEAWYWEAVDHYLPVRIDPFADAESMTEIMVAIDDFIQKFQDSDGAKLLIFDEALAVKEKTGRWFKGLMAGFNALCSMGRSRRQYGWLVSQSPNTDDFGISGGVRNVYRRILLISKDNLGLLDNGSTYFSGKPSTENLKQTGRAYFDSIINGWGSVPFYQMPDSKPVISVAVPQVEPTPSGESQRLKLEALLKLESSHEPTQPSVDLVIELLKKTAAFIKDSSNQDSDGWVKVNEFIKRGSSAEDKAQRKRAIATLRMKYSNKYEYRQVPIVGGRVSEQIRAIN